MDEVLEFVSRDIPKWNGLKDDKKHCEMEYTNIQPHLGYQLVDGGRKSTKDGEHAQENSEIMVSAQVMLLRRTHAEKEGVEKLGA